MTQDKDPFEQLVDAAGVVLAKLRDSAVRHKVTYEKRADQVDRVERALRVLVDEKPKRRLSEEGRRAISEASKRRFARQRAERGLPPLDGSADISGDGASDIQPEVAEVG